MAQLRTLVRRRNSVLGANIAARIAALVSLSVATLLVARTTGPAGVGVYALLRVLPGLAGVVLSAGLPGATTYFLAGPERENKRLPMTLVAMALAGGLLGTALWALGAPLLQATLFPRPFAPPHPARRCHRPDPARRRDREVMFAGDGRPPRGEPGHRQRGVPVPARLRSALGPRRARLRGVDLGSALR